MILSDVDVLRRYHWLMEESWTLLKHAERVIQIGAPMGIGDQSISGMPRGTNDPTAASVQHYDKYVQQLRDKAAELLGLGKRFEEALAKLDDDRQRDICRKYYALDMTDEEIGERVHMDQATVNRIRNEALAKLA